jgi:peptide-methionine (S)-S-oxide reductase
MNTRTFFQAIILAALLLGITANAAEKKTETAIFAGGCFWCVESDFDPVEGVLETVSGFSGGDLRNPSYEQVSQGGTGHLEVVRITFDPAVVSYEKLLDKFWRSVDPTDNGGQFCDRGSQYRTAVFALDEKQKQLAEQSKVVLQQIKPFAAPIVTEILPAKAFYPAEEYHQDFYKKSPIRYNYYRFSCGRDKRVKELWGSAAH